MNMDQFMSKILDICPEALFDTEFRSGEIMISTGLRLENGQIVEMDLDEPYGK
jgi:hypothetical protein